MIGLISDLYRRIDDRDCRPSATAASAPAADLKLPATKMSLPKDKAWFAAKRYGYGWGLPVRGQAWLVLLAFLLAVLAVGLPFVRRPALFVAGLVVGSALFVAVCACKGVAAKWRWGNDDDEDDSV